MPHHRCPTSPLLAVLLIAGALGCDPEQTVDPSSGAILRSSASADAMADAVLVVGNLIPGDIARNGALRYDASGAPIDAGRFVAPGTGGLGGGCCLTFGPDDYLYVSSGPHGSVLRFHPITGAFAGQFVAPGILTRSLSPAFGPDGNLYVGDWVNHSIGRFDGRTGAFIDYVLSPGAAGQAGADPQVFAFGPDGRLYVPSEATHRVLRVDPVTKEIDEFVTAGSGGVLNPSGVTFGPDGHLYVGSTGNDRVLRYDGRTGAFLGEFVPAGSGGLDEPVGLVFGPDGHLYVTSPGTTGDDASILRYDGRTGAFIDVFVPPGSAGISGPRMIEWKTKITMCHRPPGRPAAGQTISIGYRWAEEHLAHGDEVGACGNG